MAHNRQLVAIMFTDIVGYTTLMSEDEQSAFDLLHRNRELQQPLILAYNGKWIKEIGDGVLATFKTVTDAVACGIDIQLACKNISDLKLRIGIDLGEVIFEDDDVFGDGVNIASRIQALASIGGIWISEAVNKNIINKKSVQTRFVSEVILKNIKDAVEIYEVIFDNNLAENNHILSKQTYYSKFRPEKSIAVLPFVNMSNDPEQEYFSDGMAEEILNSIAHLKDLKVAGRTSSFQFKGKNIGLRELGEKLGVTTVLEGSVRRQGNTLRVTAQLIKVEDGFHLWSERYDRDMGDIFAIQDEISLAITEKLKITLLEHDRDKITKTYTQNTEAYELYLKGRFYLNRRGASILTGIKCFENAIEIDADFALAYAGFADALSLSASWGLVQPKLVMGKVKQSAEKAIQLAPLLAEPYCALGFYYNFFERNWKEAKNHYLKSIELNPRYAQVHYWYGWDYLSWIEGDFAEAQKHGELAIKLEPLSAICYGHYALILHAAGKFKEGVEICKTGIEIDPNSFLCHLSEGLCYTGLQQYEDAIA
ncbi:MAG: adenylate/guanylate cyclase domain-containing protein, partial [Chitinophagaceae bacterium]